MNSIVSFRIWVPLRKRSSRIVLGLLLALVLGGLSTAAAVTSLSYTEDFTTTTYKNAAQTTADWNTTAGELRLWPFVPSYAGGYNTPGNAYGIAISGDLAIVADGGRGVMALDITDPTSPALLGSYDTGSFSWRVAIEGDIVYVADGHDGLLAIDITDPATPALAGSQNTPDYANGVAVAGDYAFIADHSSGLLVFDVADPTNPVLAGGYNTQDEALDVAVAGDIAFVADGDDGLVVVDIKDPTNPGLLGSRNTSGYARSVAVSGNFAFVADDSEGLQVIDITNPATPVIVGNYDTPAQAYGVTVVGDVAYVADKSSGLHIIDITDPTNPTLAGGYDTPGYAIHVAVAGEYAFVADDIQGLRVIDVADQIYPVVLVGSYGPMEYAHCVAVDGDLAFVADNYNGLYILDISDPRSPALVCQYDTPGHVWGVDIAGDLAYVLDTSSDLLVLDISDPANPAPVGSCVVPGGLYEIKVEGDIALIAAASAGLQVVDISDPTNPTILDDVNTTDWTYGVAVAGNYAYIADGGNGIIVIDISNPAFLLPVGGYNTPGHSIRLEVAGEHLFVADEGTGLIVLDISNPVTPILAGVCDTPGSAEGVAVSGDLAFVADYDAGLQVIDISDPTFPFIIDDYDTPLHAWEVTTAGEYVLVTDDLGGLQIFHIHQHDFNIADNVGRSLPVDGADETIVRARLTSTAADGVVYDLSIVGGGLWTAFYPDGTWRRFLDLGEDLVWRTGHPYRGPGNPAISEMTIDWLIRPGVITSVSDVPNDQGGRVIISLVRSGYDFADDPDYTITEYNVWLRVDDEGDTEAILAGGIPVEDDRFGDDSAVLSWGGSRYLASPGGGDRGEMPPGIWANVGDFPAIQQQEYGFIAETLSDSTEAGTAWAVYCVTAHATSPTVWFASEPASGYSVDNIAPGVPEGLAFNGPNTLEWDEADEEDFAYHTVYGSGSEILDEAATLIGYTVAPTFDVSGDSHAYYHVTTSDAANNESDAATVLNPSATTPGDHAVPPVFALHAASPNPFQTGTTITFDLPERCQVRVVIVDALGRRVRTVSDGHYAAGKHRIDWDGRGDAGERVAPGIYFARIVAGYFETSQRLVHIR